MKLLKNFLRNKQGDQRLSVEKVAELRTAFSFYDKDGNGTITTQELGSVMNALGLKPSNKELQDMIASFDLNSNGELEFSEFLVMMAIYSNDGNTNSQEEEAQLAFHVFDQDGNGFITRAELQNVFQGLGEKLSGGEIDEMIREADADADGQLSFQEFKKIMKMLQSLPKRR